MASKVVTVLAAVLLVAAAMGGASMASAQQCNLGQLAVCKSAIIGGSTPTASCCANLRSQKTCFCQYAQNPAYSRYINSPNASKTLTSCGIATPHC